MNVDDDEEYGYEYSEDEDEAGSDADEALPLQTLPPVLSSTADDDRRGRGSKLLTDGVAVVLERADVEKMKHAKCVELSSMLEIPLSSAEALLRESGWSSERLMESFVCDPASLLKSAGIEAWEGTQAVDLPAYDGGALLECRICCGDVEAKGAIAAPCGHFFCTECYTMYLANAVDEGTTSVRLTCPEAKCGTLVPPSLIQRYLDAGRFGRYEAYCLGHFVSFSKELRYCPAPGCDKIARAGPGVAQVKCGCGASFCIRCGEEGHQPAGCAVLALWLEKCQNESETANWILANTKRCPKCQTRIEKNQGCNHMSCSQCKYEFCWMCMGDWTDHGATTGGYYKCNRFDPAVTGSDDDTSDAAKAKRELDRYLHYYKRYHGHDQAQKFAVRQLEATERRMVELQESTQGSWIDVQFLKAANEMVIEGRRTLKMTYVYGYYLPPTAIKQRDLFETLQEHLEKFTEHLAEQTERPVEKMDRGEIVNITRVTETFLQNLIAGAETGLDVQDDNMANSAMKP